MCERISINKLATVVVSLFAGTSLCSAVVIGDFEGGLDGWAPSGSAGNTVLSASTVGATVGTGSLQVTNAVGGFAFGAVQKNIVADTAVVTALSAAGSTVTIDITADAANITGALNLRFLVNGNSGGNEQLPIQAVTTDGTTYTMTFEPTANQRNIIANSSVWLFVGFSVTGGSGARTFHIDNIQANGTPAPPLPEGVIGNFEGGNLDDWGSSGSASGTALSTSTVGATLDSGSLQVTETTPPTFAWGTIEKAIFGDPISMADLTSAAGAVTIDVTALVADVPAGSMNLQFLVNADDGAGGNSTEQSAPSSVIIDGTSHTMTFELSQTQKDILANASSWAIIGFSSNSSGDRTWYADNIQIIGSPPVMSPEEHYEAWLATYPTIESVALEDNLYHYAIGADPTNPMTTGHHSEWVSDIIGGHFDYIVYERTDADERGLVYTVETSDSLMEESWADEGYTVVDTTEIDDDFTAVTNQIPIADPKKFVHLKVEAQFSYAGPLELDDFGGLESLAFSEAEVPNNGFFRTTFQNGQWWLATPQNHAYLSFGLNHFHSNYWKRDAPRQDANRQYWIDQFGATTGFNNDDEWDDGFYNHVKEMSDMVGANSLGYHSEDRVIMDQGRPPLFPYYRQFVPVQFSSHMNATDDDYVDIFEQQFINDCDSLAVTEVAPYKEDNMIIGWVTADIPFVTERRSLSGGRPTWAMVLQNLGSGAAGKQAYMTYIEDLYENSMPSRGGFAQFIIDYNLVVTHPAINTWDDLRAAVDWQNTDFPVDRSAYPAGSAGQALYEDEVDRVNQIMDDQNGFNRICLDRYYQVVKSAIKTHAPNHLFIGDKIQANLGWSDELQIMVEVASDHVEILMYQFYGHDIQVFGGLPYQSNTQNQIAAWTTDQVLRPNGLPMMNGDGGFGFQGDPNMNALQTPTAANHDERAEWFYGYAEDAFSHPNFIGWHICGVIDSYNPSGTDKPGLMTPTGILHTPEIEMLETVSRELYKFKGIE